MLLISGVSELKARYYKQCIVRNRKIVWSSWIKAVSAGNFKLVSFSRSGDSWSVAIVTPSICQRCGDSALLNCTCDSFVPKRKYTDLQNKTLLLFIKCISFLRGTISESIFLNGIIFYFSPQNGLLAIVWFYCKCHVKLSPKRRFCCIRIFNPDAGFFY